MFLPLYHLKKTNLSLKESRLVMQSPSPEAPETAAAEAPEAPETMDTCDIANDIVQKAIFKTDRLNELNNCDATLKGKAFTVNTEQANGQLVVRDREGKTTNLKIKNNTDVTATGNQIMMKLKGLPKPTLYIEVKYGNPQQKGYVAMGYLKDNKEAAAKAKEAAKKAVQEAKEAVEAAKEASKNIVSAFKNDKGLLGGLPPVIPSIKQLLIKTHTAGEKLKLANINTNLTTLSSNTTTKLDELVTDMVRKNPTIIFTLPGRVKDLILELTKIQKSLNEINLPE